MQDGLTLKHRELMRLAKYETNITNTMRKKHNENDEV